MRILGVELTYAYVWSRFRITRHVDELLVQFQVASTLLWLTLFTAGCDDAQSPPLASPAQMVVERACRMRSHIRIRMLCSSLMTHNYITTSVNVQTLVDYGWRERDDVDADEHNDTSGDEIRNQS